jgi:hypothetical protein
LIVVFRNVILNHGIQALSGVYTSNCVIPEQTNCENDEYRIWRKRGFEAEDKINVYNFLTNNNEITM